MIYTRERCSSLCMRKQHPIIFFYLSVSLRSGVSGTPWNLAPNFWRNVLTVFRWYAHFKNWLRKILVATPSFLDWIRTRKLRRIRWWIHMIVFATQRGKLIRAMTLKAYAHSLIRRWTQQYILAVTITINIIIIIHYHYCFVTYNNFYQLFWS